MLKSLIFFNKIKTSKIFFIGKNNLKRASFNNSKEAVYFLTNLNEDINIKDIDGNTSLHIASIEGNT